MADTWRQGATGEWASQAAWVSGLASWRLGDWNAASRAFPAGRRSSPSSASFAPAAFTGQARAEQACGTSASVERRCCDAAATSRPESFYGLLARETLGMPTKLPGDPFIGFDPPVDQLPNVQRAIELARIGEPALAEEMLRHQAKIGRPDRTSRADPAREEARPAGRAAVACQQWPMGARSDATDRYPNPAWRPAERLARRSGARLRPYRPGIRRSAAPRSAPPARSA